MSYGYSHTFSHFLVRDTNCNEFQGSVYQNGDNYSTAVVILW